MRTREQIEANMAELEAELEALDKPMKTLSRVNITDKDGDILSVTCGNPRLILRAQTKCGTDSILLWFDRQKATDIYNLIGSVL